MTAIAQSRIMILAGDGYEQSELEVPLGQLRASGATVHVVSTHNGSIKGWDKDDWGRPVSVDRTLSQVDESEYDAIVLPGGQINPDVLRTNSEAVALIGAFAKADKPVAAICHAPWLLIEAGLVSGRRATSYHSIRTDMVNAGAQWEDSKTVRDGNLITARNPGDLEPFVAAVIAAVEEAPARRSAAD